MTLKDFRDNGLGRVLGGASNGPAFNAQFLGAVNKARVMLNESLSTTVEEYTLMTNQVGFTLSAFEAFEFEVRKNLITLGWGDGSVGEYDAMMRIARGRAMREG